MNKETKFIITGLIFIVLCLLGTLGNITIKNLQGEMRIIELNIQKETLEIENKQLKNIERSSDIR